MRVLALDSTTREGSVALVVDDRIIEERRGDPSRTHAERLPAELLAVAVAHGTALAEVDLFAVASGPGSFTGLRIGIATIQGLAFTTGRPVVAVSALEALAVIGGASIADIADRADDTLVGAWMDAHRGDVFSALYQVMRAPLVDADRFRVIDAPAVGDPESTLTRWKAMIDRPITFLGDGAVLYAAALARSGMSDGRALGVPVLAGVIGRLAAARARRGEAVSPGAVQPVYVRRPDAEIERERRTLATTDRIDPRE